MEQVSIYKINIGLTRDDIKNNIKMVNYQLKKIDYIKKIKISKNL